MELKDLILCSHVTLSLFVSNLFTCPLVHLSTYLVTLSFYKQLVYLSTRSLVHLLCYSVFFAITLLTCLLVHSSTYLVTLSPFASNLSTRSLVHSSTNCLYLLNIKVNISIISIWVVWSIGVIRPILKKEYEERRKWLFVKELWEEGCQAFNHGKTVIA